MRAANMESAWKKWIRRSTAVVFAVLLAVLMTGLACAETVALPAVSVKKITNDQMTFAVEFQFDEVTEEQLSAYGNWLADYEVKLNRDIVLNADGTADGYLSGQLDVAGDAWVNIPSKAYTLPASEGLKAAEHTIKQKGLSSFVKLTFANMYANARTFNCGMYFSQAYLEAYPGLIVTVEARLYNPDDPTQSIAISEPYVYKARSVTPAEFFTYKELNGTFCAITGYIGTDAEVVIPSEIDGYIVQEISSGAFRNNGTITRVVLPESIEVLGDYVFADCKNLTTAVFAAGHTKVSAYAFQNCTALTTLTMPEGITEIGNRAFAGCTSLATIKLPDTLETIGEEAFDACTALTTIKLGDGVTTIGHAAFRNCTALESVQFGSGLTAIHSYAFENCISLTSVTLPDSVTSLAARAFWKCAELTEVNLPAQWTYVLDYNRNRHDYWGADSGYYSSPFEECAKLTKLVMPEGMTTIPHQAFRNMDSLTELVLPKTPTSIGVYAFYDADGLTEITIPEGVTTIGTHAFCYARNLAKVTFPSTLTTLEDSAMAVSGLVEADLSNTKLTQINAGAFQQCPQLKTVKLPEGLTLLQTEAFYRCPALADVSLPSTLTTIYTHAFQDCTALKALQLPDGVTSMAAGAFLNCTSLSEVNFPLSWTYVLDYNRNRHDYWGDDSGYYLTPFEKCTSLTKIVVPEGVTVIPKQAFRNMDSLVEIELPSTLVEVGSHSFYDANGLLRITLPEGVTKVAWGAFCYANSLAEVEFPSTLTEVGDYAFAETGLVEADLSQTKLTQMSTGFFQKCPQLKSVALPEGVTLLQVYTFNGCTSLTDVSLPSTLTTIYTHAFQDCTALKSLQLPDGVTSMAGGAFLNCTSLREVNFPKQWTYVLDYNRNRHDYWGDDSGYYLTPFENCTNLKTIVVPEGVTTIPKQAFRNMDSLAEIILPSTLTTIGNYAFYDADGLRGVDFPEGLKQMGEYVFCYASNLNTLSLPKGIDSIGVYAFGNCVGLRNIYLNGLETVPNYAFYNCEGLVSVVLDDGTTSIGQHAFAECNNLTAMHIPKGIESMHANAFGNCGKLRLYCYSGTVAHTTAEAAGLRFTLLDEHEHDYVTTVDTEATCLRGGSQMLTCSICSYTYIELTDPLGHDEPEEFTVTVEPGCVTEGHHEKRCIRCEALLVEEVLPALDHAWSDWVVEKEPTLFVTGLRWRECGRCGEKEEEYLPKLELEEGNLDDYGYAYFRVVDAQEKTPIVGAQLTIKLNEEDTITLVTDAEGKAAHVLPVGALRTTVYMPGMLTRNITIKVTSGECVIPDIGLSATDTVQGKLTVEEMTLQEIIDAGIDINHPDNQHVVKYAIELNFSPHIDVEALNLDFLFNGFGGNPFGDNNDNWFINGPDWEKRTDGDGRSYAAYIGPGRGPGGGHGPGGGGGGDGYEQEAEISVYPISEDFYLIIYGEIRWLKEMFDAELLVINTSMTDTLENVQATLSVPEGMSLAAMTGDQQTATINLGTIGCGQQKSTHWYLRGDKEGDYGLTASLSAVSMPFEEKIERTYKTANNIHVYAGKAMRLTYYVPDAAYYGVDYVVRAELENVSHKTLYNVSHLITGIREGKITHYSDGSVKETVYLEKNGVIAANFAKYFMPGDKLVIELSIPIHFESEIIQRQLDAVKDGITMVENISNLINFFNDAADMLEDYTDFFDSVTSLTPDSGLGDRLTAVNNGMIIAETLYNNAKVKEEVMSVWDSMRNAVQSIPVRFDLIRAEAHVLEGSTTEIPTRIVVQHVSGAPWVVQLDKYLMSVLITAFGDNVEVPDIGIWPVDFALENLVDIKEAIGYDEALAYRQAVDKQVQSFLARVPGNNIGVRVWTEHGSLRVNPVGFTGTTVDGVLNLEGSTYLEVTPNGQDDTLYVAVGDDVKAYPFKVVPAHDCKGEWRVIAYPTEKTKGFEVLSCTTCGMALETRQTYSCGDHTFGAWQVDVAATKENLGIVTRMCNDCHVVEYQIINENGGVYNKVYFMGNGGQGVMEAVDVPFDKPYTLPECGFTHDTLQFVCWNTKPDGSGINYAPGTEVPLITDATFYAIWTESGKLSYNMSSVRLSNIVLPYNAQEQAVTILGLPEGVSIVSAEGLTGTEQGMYTVTAVLVTEDPFYETPALPALTWSIQPAIDYRGQAEYTYEGRNPVANQFSLLVAEAPVLTYASITADENGAEIITDLAEAPVYVGKYRVTAAVTFGDPAYTETITADYAILPRNVMVAPDNVNWEYNGEKAVNNSWTANNLISGDSVTGYTIEGGEILPGEYENAYTISNVIITDRSGKDVTENYIVNCMPGHLLISKRAVTVSVDDVVAEYDGQAHGGSKWHAGNLLEGHSITGVTIPDTGVAAGRYINWLMPEGATVVDSEGNSLMHLYKIKAVPGNLIITQRPMTITVNDVTCTYQSAPVTHSGWTQEGLLDDHSAQMTITGEATVPGSYPDIFRASNVMLTDSEGNDVTLNYAITKLAGDLTIKPAPLTVTAASLTHEYDGQEVTCSEYTVEGLQGEDTLTGVAIEGSYQLPGVYEDAFTPVEMQVVAADGMDVTGCYDITAVSGSLTIAPRALTLTAEDRTVAYTGETHVAEAFTADRLLDGHTVSSIAYTGGAKLAGTHTGALTLAEAIITDADGADVTAHYAITCQPGSLTITPVPLTVTAAFHTHEYNGEAITGSEYTAEGLVSEDAITSVTMEGSYQLPGEYEDAFMPVSAQIMAADGTDVTDCYVFTGVSGSLSITPRVLTIAAEDRTVSYTGDSHTANAFAADRLVDGHSVNSIIYTGGAKLAGIYDDALTLEQPIITDAQGADVTAYYAITLLPGDLTITPAPLTVTASSLTHEYDGQAVICKQYTASGLQGAEELECTPMESGCVLPGAYDNVFVPTDMQVIAPDGTDVTACYAITVESGSLTIMPRLLTITAEDRFVICTGNTYLAENFTADRLLDGHTVSSIARTGGAAEEGVHPGALMLADAVISDETGADVTACYAITYEAGTLTIVSLDASDVTISAHTLYLREGDKVRLEMERINEGNLVEMTWHSDSENISVTDDGVVTCHAAGSATITVTAKGMTEILASCTVYPDDMKQLSLPTMLSQVEEEAWMNNPALRVVDLSNTIEPTIGDRAFKDCGKLVKVLLPEKTTFGADAFDGCSDVVLYCTDSEAAAYAKAQGIPYVMLIEIGN